MTRDDLATIVWLRWRLTVNQLRSLTTLSRIFLLFVLYGSVASGMASFTLITTLGPWFLPDEWSSSQIHLWDALACGFCVTMAGDAFMGFQNTESISLKKLLPLPISPWGAFLLNLLSSLVSPVVIYFVPVMLAFCFAMTFKYGFAMILSLPLTICFLIFATACAHHFRYWLALLMGEPRRQVLIFCGFFIFIAAAYYIPKLYFERAVEQVSKETGSNRREAREIVLNRLMKHELVTRFQSIGQHYRWLPPFWLSDGIDALAKGRFGSAFAAGGGMLALGAFGLDRAYRSVLRLVRHESFSGRSAPGKGRRPPGYGRPVRSEIPKARSPWLERGLSWLSPGTEAVARLTALNLYRSPAGVFGLTVAVAYIIAIGGALHWYRASLPTSEFGQTLLTFGIWALTAEFGSDVIRVQFTLDGIGFRTLMLAPLRECDLLFGKNIVYLIRFFALSLIALAAVYINLSITWWNSLANLFQLGSLFLIYCLTGNLFSILSPIAPMQGGQRASVMLLQFLVLFLCLLTCTPLVVPIALDGLLDELNLFPSVPFNLLGSVACFAVIAVAYPRVVRLQAKLLEKRKWHVLETVTNVAK
jgi:hypothetical protein